MAEGPFSVVQNTYGNYEVRCGTRVLRVESTQTDANEELGYILDIWEAANGPTLQSRLTEAEGLVNRMHAKLSRILEEGGHFDSDDLAAMSAFLLNGGAS
jgi:hypothetical protein